MQSLRQIICHTISSEGPISFERFMEMALYHPAHGYYARDCSPTGTSGGDFYTSPHVHAFFGACLGAQMEEMWRLTGKPRPFKIVEMGAGRGHLAKDVLDFLKERELYDSVAYTVIEPNRFFQGQQAALLEDHQEKVEWLPGLDSLPGFTGCFLSNELLDAFPVRLVEIAAEIQEIYIDRGQDGRLIEIKKLAPPEVSDYIAEFAPGLAGGYRTEVNLRARDWLHLVADRLHEGFVLTIDYGFPASEYFMPERTGGTLLCYQGHATSDNPYEDAGSQDITAHVNFSALKRWGEELSLKTSGYTSQGSFLVSLGAEDLLARLVGDPPDPVELSKVKTLFMPQGLGESHKVLVQYKGPGNPGPLKGFSLRNESRRL